MALLNLLRMHLNLTISFNPDEFQLKLTIKLINFGVISSKFRKINKILNKLLRNYKKYYFCINIIYYSMSLK